MPIIKVAKRFLLKDDKDGMTEYVPGDYEVDDATASHWYVIAHCDGYVAPLPVATYAAAELRVAQAARIGGTVAPPPEAKDPAAPVNFAGRAMPKEPDQLHGFTDPRTIDPVKRKA